jgi:hypothetical protein
MRFQGPSASINDTGSRGSTSTKARESLRPIRRRRAGRLGPQQHGRIDAGGAAGGDDYRFTKAMAGTL